MFWCDITNPKSVHRILCFHFRSQSQIKWYFKQWKSFFKLESLHNHLFNYSFFGCWCCRWTNLKPCLVNHLIFPENNMRFFNRLLGLCVGCVDKSWCESNFGHPWACHYKQRSFVCHSQWFQHMDPCYSKCSHGRSRWVNDFSYRDFSKLMQ